MNPKKCIGFYCSSTSFGGLQLHMLRLAAWMQERGWPVIVYVLKDHQMYITGKEMGLTLHTISRNRKYADVLAGWNISRLFKRDKIEILFLRDSRDLSVAGIAKGLMGNKIQLIYQQGMQLGISKRDVIHTARFNKLDAWLSPLNLLADQVKQKTKFTSNRLHVVKLGLELSKFTDNKISQQEARETLKLPGQVKLIGNIGRFGPQKQQDLLVRGLSQIRDAGIPAHLLLMGESTRGEGESFKNSLITLINELGLKDFVHIRPFMEDVSYFYSSIDIFALSSQKETYGMVTIEAMSSGLPIIATNAGGTKEILKMGAFGVLYDPSSAEDFAKKAVLLLRDEIRMKELGTSAQQEAKENYSHDTECQKIEEIISTLS